MHFDTATRQRWMSVLATVNRRTFWRACSPCSWRRNMN